MIPMASRMELLQLSVACVGLGFALWGLWSAVKDALRTSQDEPRRILAYSHIRSQTSRIAAHSLLVFGGAASITLPPPPPTNDSQQSTLIYWVLVGVTVILSIDYGMDRRVRFVFNNHPWFKKPPSHEDQVWTSQHSK